MAQYGKLEYWEDRYNKEKEQFDWYQRYSGLKDIVTQYVQPTFQILNVGCGNSRLSEEMADDGYQNIKNIDLSLTCIKYMQDLCKDKYPTMPFEQMDVRSMNYDDGAFDAVVDKGTFDSILCGDGSGPNADQMLSEIHRVLSPQGVYICISYGVKDTRLKYFQKADYSWTVFHHMVAKPTISTSQVVREENKEERNFHWIYIMRKMQAAKE